jgi:hypothetical protein
MHEVGNLANETDYAGPIMWACTIPRMYFNERGDHWLRGTSQGAWATSQL